MTTILLVGLLAASWPAAGYLGHRIALTGWKAEFGNYEGAPSWTLLAILGWVGLLAGCLILTIFKRDLPK